jgi:uncharacterized membrane protein
MGRTGLSEGEFRRIEAVDALRGLVMIVMVLDHVRDFNHSAAMAFSPEDLTRTTAAIFLTRWVTHICAPVFMFTAGLGAFFWRQRGRTTAELTGFLWKRGVWLIVLDLVVIRLSMFFSLSKGPVILLVLWALGCCMIALGLLAHLPVRWLAALSVAMIAGHNLADGVRAAQFGGMGWLWNILHQPGAFRAGGVVFVAAYPLVPWIGVMAAGFCFGEIMRLELARQRQWTLRIGAGLTTAFLVLRGMNGYGDPQPWTAAGHDLGTTVLSFLRCTKYPPSLAFLLMTLGPALLLLGWFGGVRWRRENPLMVFGRTPLFFFLTHFLACHLVAIPIALARYGQAGFLWQPMPSLGGSAAGYPPDFGVGLAATYGLWVGLVAALYPLCRWWAGVKERERRWWMAYL